MNGNIFTGIYRNGLKHGQGSMFIKKTGFTYSGNYHKDIKYGEFHVLESPNGDYRLCTYVNGKLDGEYVKHDHTGTVLHTKIYENGVLIPAAAK